ncbi:MAG: deoxyribose-phosphate aldolase [Anaerolineae bacterium]|nr:deoxyribose-phosphate aldolase [Anaerolineae bacterium]
MVDLSKMDKKALAKVFDYSVLPKDTNEAAIRKGCEITRQYQFAAFYSSSPYWTPIIVDELKDYPDIEIGTGIAFPFGSAPANVKAFETEEAVKRGCTAVDMVMNIGALKDKRYDVVKDELKLFVKAAGKAVTKCILETNFLTDEEVAAGCKIILETGVQYAKTSSGQFEGPSLEQFMVMRRTLEGTDVKLKVAGVKFPRPQNAYTFLMAGADRIGTRAAPEIIDALDLMREIGVVPKMK